LVAVALLAGSFSLCQAASPAKACACGAPAPIADDPNGDVLIGHEYAVISLQGTTEQVDMRLAVHSMAKESGLIMPTPTVAKVSLGDAAVFEALAVQMTPIVETNYDWWTWGWSLFPTMDGSGGAPPRGPVEVLDQVELGPLEAVVLAADDASGLTDWLNANGYGVRDEITPILDQYIEQGWYFVAVKLVNEETLDGDLDPIRFTFEIPESGPVYPLALSQAARVEQTVNLYIFDEHQRSVTFTGDESISYWQGGDATWAGAVDEPSLLEYGNYLTAYSLYFYSPEYEIKGDLVMPQAKADSPRGQVVYATVYVQVIGIPLGWLIVVAVLLAGLAVVLMGRARRLAR